MNLSLVICILVAVVVSVRCHGANHAKKHHDYTAHQVIECRDHRQGILKSMKKSTCMLHDTLVPLKNMPTQEFRPAMVSVKRCNGHCSGLTCMPTDTHMIKVPVRLAHHGPNNKLAEMCAHVDVEEHTACKCMCVKKKEDCNERQYYMQTHCACLCKDQDTKKRDCEAQMGMMWNDEDCTCNCTEMNMECTTGLKWSREKCACVQ